MCGAANTPVEALGFGAGSIQKTELGVFLQNCNKRAKSPRCVLCHTAIIKVYLVRTPWFLQMLVFLVSWFNISNRTTSMDLSWQTSAALGVGGPSWCGLVGFLFCCKLAVSHHTNPEVPVHTAMLMISVHTNLISLLGAKYRHILLSKDAQNVQIQGTTQFA